MDSMFVKVNHKDSGAFSLAELKNLIAAGGLSADAMVYSEDGDHWVEAGQVEELKRLFSKPIEQRNQKKVFAIGGGKGGVGKTLMTASLGIGLATMGRDVVIVDADFGSANLHTCMGILEPRYTYYQFYTKQREKLEDILLDTPINNLKLISGACGILGLANPKYYQKLRFISHLKKLYSEFILLDLGAGSSYNVIDFFLAADEGIIVTSPDPMAIQDSFGFLKVCILRKLLRTFKNHTNIRNFLERDDIVLSGSMSLSMDEIQSKISNIDRDAGVTVEEILTEFRPKLILNMVHNNDDIKQGMAFQTAAAELLSINVEYLGYMEFDERIFNTVKNMRPFMISNPRSNVTKNLANIISLKLLGNNGIQGYREKRKFHKQMMTTSYSYPSTAMQKGSKICSVHCFHWDDCEYQKGGYPCAVRRLEPVFNT